jgi:hypothetical protein
VRLLLFAALRSRSPAAGVRLAARVGLPRVLLAALSLPTGLVALATGLLRRGAGSRRVGFVLTVLVVTAQIFSFGHEVSP